MRRTDMILSVDPGSVALGYALWNKKNGKLIRAERILAQQKMPIEERLVHIIRELWTIVQDMQGIDIICEDSYCGANQLSSVKPLVRIQGALLAMSIQCGGTFRLVYPNQWRKELGIKGKNRNELKANDILYALEHYGHLFPEGFIMDDNVADAICIGDVYFKQNGINKEVGAIPTLCKGHMLQLR